MPLDTWFILDFKSVWHGKLGCTGQVVDDQVDKVFLLDPEIKATLLLNTSCLFSVTPNSGKWQVFLIFKFFSGF